MTNGLTLWLPWDTPVGILTDSRWMAAIITTTTAAATPYDRLPYYGYYGDQKSCLPVSQEPVFNFPDLCSRTRNMFEIDGFVSLWPRNLL